MKVLLISDDADMEKVVRGELDGKDATLRVETDPGRIERFIARERPQIVVNAILDQTAYDEIRKIKFPPNYQVGHDFWSYELYHQPMDQTMQDSIAFFLRCLPIQNRADTGASPFIARGGKGILRTTARPPRRVTAKMKDARAALTEAKEALAGVVSYQEEPTRIGNRVPVPLSREVLQAIDLAVDTSIALTATPVITRDFTAPLKRMANFLREAENVIKQVEKAATAAVKAAAVLGVLAAAIAAAAGKLSELARLLGLGG